MSCLGVLFSISDKAVLKLQSFDSDYDRLDYFQLEIEEQILLKEPKRFAELDKAWDALHRSLTDGKLFFENGIFPNNSIVLGGVQLYLEDDDYIMSLKSPQKVQEIARVVNKIRKEDLRKGYDCINVASYGVELSDDDFEYTWAWFEKSIAFWQKAAEEKRHVLFVADQ
jgi:Domain of unknown function (DUF1877)